MSRIRILTSLFGSLLWETIRTKMVEAFRLHVLQNYYILRCFSEISNRLLEYLLRSPRDISFLLQRQRHAWSHRKTQRSSHSAAAATFQLSTTCKTFETETDSRTEVHHQTVPFACSSTISRYPCRLRCLFAPTIFRAARWTKTTLAVVYLAKACESLVEAWLRYFSKS